METRKAFRASDRNPDQNGTPKRCASRAASAHRASRPGRPSAAGLPGKRPASPGAGVRGAVPDKAGGGRSITRACPLAAGRRVRESLGRPPLRAAAVSYPDSAASSTDSTRPSAGTPGTGGRAVRAVSDMPPCTTPVCPQQQVGRSPPGTGSVRTAPAGAAVRERLLPRRLWRSPTPRECPDRPAARR